MSLPHYSAEEIANHRSEIRGALRSQPSWVLRDGWLKKWLSAVPKDVSITDLGSGSGELERQLGELGYRNVTCVDIDEYIDPVFIGFQPRFLKADISNGRIDLPDASQDVVFAIQMLEHLENPWNCAREILRIAKPGAKIFVSIPHATSFINRLTFLLTGQIDTYGVKNNHISLFTNATFWLLWRGQARILRTVVGEGYVKFFGHKLRFPAHTRLGRMCTRKIAYVMEKR